MIIEALGNTKDLEEQRDKRKSTVFVDHTPSEHIVKYRGLEIASGWLSFI